MAMQKNVDCLLNAIQNVSHCSSHAFLLRASTEITTSVTDKILSITSAMAQVAPLPSRKVANSCLTEAISATCSGSSKKVNNFIGASLIGGSAFRDLRELES
jgi:hypothetical protein